jgi:hypothetical protein
MEKQNTYAIVSDIDGVIKMGSQYDIGSAS